jgi:hypothetical protein
MKIEKNIRIIITFTFEAVHSWHQCNIPEVSFLSKPHRHIFHVEMKKRVHHDDRDIEFILFKREVMSWVKLYWEGKNLGSKSCEMMAITLLDRFDCEYVKVMEDGENGAEVWI